MNSCFKTLCSSLKEQNIEIFETEISDLQHYFDISDNDIFDDNKIQDISSLISYLIRTFGSCDFLLKFLKAQQLGDTGYDMFLSKHTFLDISPKEKIGAQIEFLKNLFSLSQEQCINLICDNPDWFYKAPEYFNKRITALSNFFEVGREEIAKKCCQYPFLLGKHLGNIEKIIDKIQSYYGVDKQKVKSLMFFCPNFVGVGVKYFIDNKLPIEIFDNHWLLDCITGKDNMNYAGYSTFNNLCSALRFIQQHFGKIVRILNRRFKEGNLTAVIAQKDNFYFIITLGGNLLSDSELKFQSRSESYIRLIKALGLYDDEYYVFHNEYFCKVDTIDNDYFENALALLFFSALSGRKEYTIKDTCVLYDFSEKKYILPDVDNLILTETIDDKFSLTFNALVLESEGVVKVIEPKTDDDFDFNFNLFEGIDDD